MLGLFLLLRTGCSFTQYRTYGRPTPARRPTFASIPPPCHGRGSIECWLADRNVAAVTTTDDSPEVLSPTTPTTLLDRPALAVIDGLVLLLFAAIGKSSHSTAGSLDLLATVKTAAPFWAAWYATSGITQSYSTTKTLQDAALQTVRAWGVAIPLGIALRGLSKGAIPPLSFAIVTLLATLVLLVGARVGWYALTTGIMDRADSLEHE